MYTLFGVWRNHLQFSADYETKKMAENNAKSAKDSETDFPNKRRNQILAGIFATAAMTGYALSTGLVEVTYCKV